MQVKPFLKIKRVVGTIKERYITYIPRTNLYSTLFIPERVYLALRLGMYVYVYLYILM